MKKILLFVAATAGLLLAGSCQRENLEPVQQGGTVTYTIQVPGDLATKASGDGFTLYYEVYRLNELGDSNAKPVYEGSTAFSNGSADVKLEFVKNQKFTVLFWAQKTTGAQAYDIEDLRKVSLKTLVANDASAEVFAGKDEVDNCVSEANGNVELVRPVAQLNIATTAASLTLGSTPIVPTESKVTIDGLYGEYNVATGAVDTKAERIYAEADVPGDEFKGGAYNLMATNFLGFIPKEGDNVEVKFTIITQNDGQIEHTVSNVPVKPNYQTNILGNLISATADYNVTLGAWETPETNVQVVSVSTAQDLQEAIDNIPTGSEGNIILEGDIDLGALAGMISTKAAAPAYGLKIPADKTVIIDLNGNTLSWTSANQNNWMIENKGTLSLIGEGNVVYNYAGVNDPAYGKGNYTISNSGNLVVDGPTVSIKVNGQANNVKYAHALYVVQNSGKLTLESGRIENYHNVAVRQWIGSETVASEVVVNGGEIYGIRAIWMQLPNGDTSKAPKGILTINGGALSAWENAPDYDSENKLAVYSYSYGNQMKNVEINVAGGTINGDIALNGGRSGAKVDVEKVTVTGGTFNGYYGDLYSYAKDDLAAPAITIKGGQFSSLYPMTYLNAADEMVTLKDNLTLTEPVTFNGVGTLDLNGKTLAGESETTGKNYDMIDVRGNLTVKNGTITAEFKGTNMGWNNSTNVFNVTAGGVLNLNGVTAKNLGGSDMAFVAHLNNWGEVTLNAENCILESTYISVRVFNSGYDMNNVTIKNSTLKGKYCFWVHNYKAAGDSAGDDSTLNFDIFNGTNTFVPAEGKAPVLYGFNNPIYLDENGNVPVATEEALVAALKRGGNIALVNDITLSKSIALSNANFSLDGYGKTIRQADGCTNTYALFDITGGKATIKNVTFDGVKEGAVVRTVDVEFTADNVTAKNCEHTQIQGLFRLMGKSTITNCNFKNNTCNMVITLNYDGANNDPQVVENCIFENNTCNATAVLYYVKGAGATINGNKFVGNTVNCNNNGATVYMGFQENTVVTNNLFQDNTVNEASTSSRVAGGIFFGYENVFTGNAFINNKVTGEKAVANDVCISTYYTDIDLSGNYWGGNAPVENTNYFQQHKDNGFSVIINNYLTENPIK